MSAMARNEALIGSAAFLLVAPGTVAGLVPWFITHWRFGDDAHVNLMVAGGVLIVAGLAVLLESFVRFALRGGGTPAPLAPTAHLVVTGAYRYVRNPMYVAVVALIFGQALLFANAGLIAYGITIAFAFHVFVVGYEEKRLEREFGEDYARYCANVRRWRPRLTPWRG